MKIAWIVPGFSRDEADWAIPALQSLATAFAAKHELHVFSLRYPESGSYQFDGITVHATGGGTRFGRHSPLIWRRTWRALLAEHRRAPFDALHAFWADEPGLVAVYAAARLRLPAIVSVAGGELTYLADIDYGTYRSPWRRSLIRLALARATAVTAGSRYEANLVHYRGIPADRVTIIPLGVDIDHFQPAPTPPSPFTIVQAASFVPVKDQALLLHTLAALREEIADARLFLAGDGPLYPSLLELARRLSIADHITWHGRLPHPAIPAFYQAAHCYVQSSRHESQGMSLLEALACGLPAVGTPVGVLPEVAALPGSASATVLAAQLTALWRNRPLYESRREVARQTAVRRFALTRCRERFESLYLTPP